MPWVRYLLLAAVLVGAAYVGFNWRSLSEGLLEPTDDAAPAIAAAEQALYSGHVGGYEDAIGMFDRVSRQWPTDPRGYVGLSRAHARIAEASVAPTSGAAAVTADGGQPEAAPRPTSRESRQAMRYAEEALELAPADLAAKVALADAMRLLGRDADAVELVGTLGSAGPNADLHRLRGLMATGTEAMTEYRAGVALRPSDVGLRLLLLRSLLDADEPEAARAELDALAENAPDHPDLSSLHERVALMVPPTDGGLGDAAAVAAESPEERPPAREAQEADSPSGAEERDGQGVPAGRDYSWYISRGEDLQERGNISGARAHFERALSLRPGSSEALTGMGYLALSAGDYAGAARRFEPATRSGYASAYIGLGRAYRGMGRLQEALRAYERYLERRSSGGEAAIARRQVEALREQLGRGASEEPPPAPVPAQEPPAPPETPPPPPEVDEPPPPPAEAPEEPAADPEPAANELPTAPPPPPLSTAEPPPPSPPTEGSP